MWKKENNEEKRNEIEKKIINIIQSVDSKMCDHYQVLILATSFEFKPAIVHIFERNKQLSNKFVIFKLITILLYINQCYVILGIPS